MTDTKTVIFDLDETIIGSILCETGEEAEKIAGKSRSHSHIQRHEELDLYMVQFLRPHSKLVLSKANEQFDNVVLWSHHHSGKSGIKEVLCAFGVGGYFDKVVSLGDPIYDSYTDYNTFTKDLSVFAQVNDLSIDNVVLIQDNLWSEDDLAAKPAENCVFIKPYRPAKFGSSFDRTLLKAYDFAVKKVFK
jgi:hypothetical protein